jgi:hypothetical protein
LASNSIKQRLNVKKGKKFMKKREKIEILDNDLDWKWTTICIYKKQGKKI